MRSKPRSKIWIFIPSFNVEELVVPTLGRLPKDVEDYVERIVIVDNDSSDNTRSNILSYIKDKPLFSMYHNKMNYSLGGSTVFAFQKAIENNVDYLICLHSDGQAPPEILHKFREAIESGDNCDFILGSRFLSDSECDDYSRLRLYANLAFSRIQQLILKQNVYDLGSYIAFNMKTIREIPYDRVVSDMGYHPNLILTAAKTLGRPLKLKEFPITWGKVEVSHVNIWDYGVRHLARLMRFMLSIPQLREPLNVESRQIQ